jgi:hypothetical protein
VGLLSNSFRPPQLICAIREIFRHRTMLVEQAADSIRRMQKSLTEMNVLVHNVVSDITGQTGLAIIDAIIAGDHNPQTLALHRDPRVKAKPDEIKMALQGNYRPEHLFTLEQSRQAYSFYQKQIAACDARIEIMIKDIDGSPPSETTSTGNATAAKINSKNAVKLPSLDLRAEMVRIFGVDLATVPGVGLNVLCTILAEVGPDLSRFPTVRHFVSWLRLCPNPRISGGRKIGNSVPHGTPRLALALRIATQSLERNQSYLGTYFRKMKYRFGPKTAAKATANKLARILYAMITTATPYSESNFESQQKRSETQRLLRLTKEAAHFGLLLQPVPAS